MAHSGLKPDPDLTLPLTLVSDEDPVSLSSPLDPGTVQRVVRLLLQLLKVVHLVICLVGEGSGWFLGD